PRPLPFSRRRVRPPASVNLSAPYAKGSRSFAGSLFRARSSVGSCPAVRACSSKRQNGEESSAAHIFAACVPLPFHAYVCEFLPSAQLLPQALQDSAARR